MEQATIQSVSNETVRNNFRYREVMVKTDGEYTREMLLKATKNASDFARNLKAGDKVVLIYPGEIAPFEGTVMFVTPESKKGEKGYWNEHRVFKIFFNNGGKL